MRRLALLTLCLATTAVNAAGFSEKDTPFNTRYKESPEEAAAREFAEQKTALPPLPDTQSGDWFDLYVSEDYGKQPKNPPQQPANHALSRRQHPLHPECAFRQRP